MANLSNSDEEFHRQSVAMLLAVINGRSYEAIAAELGFARTTVERRVKRVAQRISQGVDGSGERRSLISAKRIRSEGLAVTEALQTFDPNREDGGGSGQPISEIDVVRAAQRVRHRGGAMGRRDAAMFYTLFATGARPLEIARLEVADYLEPNGSVRRNSTFRAEVTINGKPRPLYFASGKLTAAIDDYLDERAAICFDPEALSGYRGLDPRSRLFLGSSGQPFEVVAYGENGQHRFLCRGVLDTYRKIFRNAELHGASPLSARRYLADLLYDRRAEEEHVGLLLGMDRRTVRRLFPRTKPTIDELVADLV